MSNFILFDDHNRDALLPFTYTRPVADIRVGILTIREKWECYLGAAVSVKTEGYLQKKIPVRPTQDGVYISASVLPDKKLTEAIMKINLGQLIMQDGQIVAYRGEQFFSYNDGFIEGLEKLEYEGSITKIENTWDIFSKNYQEIESDYTLLTKNRKSAPLPEYVNTMKPENIFLEEGAVLEHCTINASEGPVYIGKNAKVLDGSLLRGPLVLGDNALVKMGAKIYGGTTIGPHCKVGGEINNSVLFAYSNKAHDGYLGNSVIGEWCNLGADTNISNLKNNYAEVRLWNYREEKFSPTGLQFCGLMMGDHSKCGINTMFNTGTVVGVSANIFGSGYPRNFIPSFSWGGASGFSIYHTRKAFEVMKAVLKRKDLELEEEDIEIIEHIFEITKKWRKG